MAWKILRTAMDRLFGPDPRALVEGSTVERGTEGDDKEAQLKSSSMAALTPQQAFPEIALDLTFGVDESGAQPTLAAATLTTTNEEVVAKSYLEGLATSSEIAQGPRNKYGVEYTLETTYPVWPIHEIDNLLDLLFGITCGSSATDDSGKAEAMATAKAEGGKVRDLAATANNAELTKKEYNEFINSSVPEIFDAHEKALQFHYMRMLYIHGIFDLPSRTLTVEDVDRLYTIGFITGDLDFVTGRMMLGHGALRRTHRQNGRPTADGEVLAPRARWTIPTDSVPPTQDEIAKFILKTEGTRFHDTREKSKWGLIGSSEFQLPGALRPILSEEWKEHFIKTYGIWGLKKLGMDDEAAEKLISSPDLTYVPPKAFQDSMKTRVSVPLNVPLDTWCGKRAAAAAAVDSCEAHIAQKAVAAVESHKNASAELVDVPSSPILATCLPRALSTPSPLQSGTTSKGKKRASPDEDASCDGPFRRTRARVIDAKPCNEPETPSVSASPSAARVQRRRLSKPIPREPMLSTKSQGTKRQRDEGSESTTKPEDGCSPTKKHRGASGSVSPARISDPAPAPAPVPIIATSPTAGAVSQAPQTAPGESHVVRQPLQRHRRMLINYESNTFTELPKTDIRRGHGMTFPGADEDGPRLFTTPQPPLTCAETMESVRNWRILCDGLITVI